MAVISGEAKWASVIKPNTTYEPCWTIDVVINAAQKKNLEDAGFKTKVDKDGDTVFKVKRKVTSMEGKDFDPPEVVDTAGNPFTKLIGNKSKVKVKFSAYDWTAFGNAGKAAWLDKVIVLEHVPYEEEDETDFDTGAPVVKAASEESFDDDTPF